ncbi:phage head protein/prohead protease [Xenorhabdus mauleonii]|uniref:Phage head protein/prohead protease n=1 Tax=Xenorhabdus mauleonii TaxID=351675 RepID=A0A1I3WNG2_9GAMM|nr:DUF2213 domain-containing protein [Xenorhabdus mauleonii]PHM39278.1 phage head protein/prohead protease [Xenorhabdus mauleonii]SFK09022.1 hypothetical protein SAMN05421680_12831 [Xenorhabdus mauleonii]
MKYFFTTRLGNTRYQLADGSLLCKDVPIARTGTQLYADFELPTLEPDDDGEIVVERSPEEVFSEATLASFEGMTITIKHPEDARGNVMFVDPDNWRDLAHGHVQNVRRGEGEQSDLMLADLIIKDTEAIEAIDTGFDEVSCGYDAEYRQTAEGKAEQYQITGNHVALVQDARAGSRCSIGDSMSNTAQKWFSRLKRAVKTKDSAAMEEVLNNAPESLTGDEGTGELPKAININISPQQPLPKEDPEMKTGDEQIPEWANAILARLDALEGKSGTGDNGTDPKDPKDPKDPEKTGDDDEKDEKEENITGDSAYKAELIVPGIDLSTPSKLTTFKRQVLVSADQAMVRNIVGDAEIKKLPKRVVDMAFNAVAELAKGRNTQATGDSSRNKPSGNHIADLNKANAEFWANRSK